ncbi:MAG: hypothetical protein K8W52_46910, partial [Deltaproteobacteria bacterium]|nr:hypothetical protein [Deltaproteobacteria bacterium]
AVAALPARAAERLIRRVDAVGQVTTLAQSRDGALWMGTSRGLRRHDGRDWTPIATDAIRTTIHRLVAHPDGMLVGEEYGPVWFLAADGAAPRQLVDDAGRPFRGPVGLAAAPSGATWVADAHGVWTGAPLALRRVPVPAALIAEVPRVIAIGADGGAFIATLRGLWHVAPDGRSERLADAAPPAALLVEGDAVWHLAWGGALTRWQGGALAPMFALDPATTRAKRGISLVRRGATLWVAYDLVLVALRPDRAPEILTASADLPSGGPLLVDREGSLWLGTFRGLRQLPEPETVALTDVDGMPSAHGRFVALTAEGVWLATWQGVGLLRNGAARAELGDPPEAVVRRPLCVDGAGRLWGGAGRRLFLRAAGVSGTVEIGGAAFYDCVSEAGRVWIGTDAGVFAIDPDAAAPVRVGAPPPDATGAPLAEQIAIDARGRIWIARDAEVCVASGARAEPADWACLDVPGAVTIRDLWVAPSGALWLATRPGGLMRVVADGDGGPRFEPWADGTGLPGGIETLAPSPRGGVWVTTPDGPRRIVEDRTITAGWREVERLGPWQGLVTSGVTHVAEDPDGGLWLASTAGLIAVPAAARAAPLAPPTVAIIDLTRASALAGDARVALPAGDNMLALGFAPSTRRAPELVRYRVRTDRGAWSAPGPAAELQLRDLSSGERTLEVEASLDGVTWGPAAQLMVAVATPWFQRAWVWAVAAAILALALAALHRARVAVHVRLERQRIQIAMELHDEMGSGLGSIGMLASVATAEPDGGAMGREVAATIATTATELGHALGDIVGALRRGSGTLDLLGQRLASRAQAALPAGVALGCALDGLPALPLRPAVARAVLMIGHEALHNVARHAGATRVTIGVRPIRGRRWCLWIEDDGCGLGDRDDRGLGLTSMAARARTIDARLTITAGADGRGTRVELAFAVARRAPPREIASLWS